MNKYGHNMTWEEWLIHLHDYTGGEIDRVGISEETARVTYPTLYAYYAEGCEPENYVDENITRYKDEGDYIEIWTDPDEPDDYDEELEAILSNTEFYQTFSLEISDLKILNNINAEDIKNTNANNIMVDKVSAATALATLRKQLFVSAITCLETYLSDAFINTILSDKEYLKLFFKSYKDFEHESFQMNTLFDTFDKADKIATKKMLEVIYHNIPKVKQMYKTTLGVSFPEIKTIAKYVSQRHDLVHRNGKELKVKGKILYVSKEDVDKVITDVESFVREIDRQLKNKVS